MTSRLNLTQINLIIICGIFIGVFHNYAYFRNIAEFYADSSHLPLIIFSTGLLHICILWIVLAIIGFKRFIKPILIFLLLSSSLSAYFIDSYNVIIDKEMLINVQQTNSEEAMDLLTLKLIFYFLLLGLLPSVLIYKVNLVQETLKKAALKRLFLIIGSLLVILITIFSNSDFYASFLRENKILRYYANPTKPLESIYKYAADSFRSNETSKWKTIGSDAKKPEQDDEYELVVLVIGETARAENFSLNGYSKPTNPLLAKQNVISFSKVSSCGTTTAVSVPCMFSFQERTNYEKSETATMDNALDILKRAGVAILWRENNTGAKGVADHVDFEDFRNPDVNPVCDVECRDEGMLHNLDKWLENQPPSDVLIVLHQMGSHGPAYFKRYPASFEKFKPTCETNQLENCSNEQIRNTYDNTILYTDYFLAKTIEWLKSKTERYEASMMYISDHGESLGESGLFLHGFPYMLAPDTQTHVPAIFWGAENNSDIDVQALMKTKDLSFSHDNLFHTLLGMFEIESDIYQKEKDLLKYRYRY